MRGAGSANHRGECMRQNTKISLSNIYIADRDKNWVQIWSSRLANWWDDLDFYQMKKEASFKNYLLFEGDS